MPLQPYVYSLIYKSYILPLFDYCDIVWVTGGSITSLNALDRLYSKAIRFISRGGNSNLVSLQDRRKFHMALFAYKILFKFSPSFLFNSISFTHSITHRNSKNAFRVLLPYVRTNYGKNAFYFKSVNIWNNLNSSLYSCRNVNDFKLNYKVEYYF